MNCSFVVYGEYVWSQFKQIEAENANQYLSLTHTVFKWNCGTKLEKKYPSNQRISFVKLFIDVCFNENCLHFYSNRKRSFQ